MKKKSSRTFSTPSGSKMEELLTRRQVQGMKRGDQVEARVISISNRQGFFDLGGKSEGVVEGRGYDSARDFIKGLKVGDKINVVVVIPETRAGLTLVSLRNTAENEAFEKLEEAARGRENVWVTVVAVTKGGLSVDFQGISGFIPMSQLGVVVRGHLQNSVGRQIEVVPLEVDRARARVLLSEREVSEKEQIEEQKKIILNLKAGEIYEGEVASVLPFGVFVQIVKDNVPVEGLIHGSRIPNLEDFKEGKKVAVRVINAEDGRIAFDLGARSQDISKYEKDMVVLGRVLRVTGRSGVVELKPGVTAQLALNTLPPGTVIKPGESYDFFIESLDHERARVTVGLVLKAKPVGYK